MTKLRSYTRQILSLSYAFFFAFFIITGLVNVSYAEQISTQNTLEKNSPSTATTDVSQGISSPNLRSNLHQEVNALLAENTRINQEKRTLLESDAQKVFWTQCLVGLMSLFMLVSLFSFWRLHAKAAFSNRLAGITTGIRQFQDSILSFIDTRQLAHNSVVSSFHSSGFDQGPESLQEHTITKTNLNPNTEQEMSQVKSFVDAWLNVYTPGASAHDRYVESTKNRPTSPLPWLSMIRGFRQENDQTNFESIRKEIKKLFNINVPSWSDHNDDGQKQIADYPHVLNKILELWHGDNIAAYLERLLANSRINGRQGFDIALYENLENLMKLAQEPNRPRHLEELKKVPLAAFLFNSAKAATNAQKNTNKTPNFDEISAKDFALKSRPATSILATSTAATVSANTKSVPAPDPIASTDTSLFDDATNDVNDVVHLIKKTTVTEPFFEQQTTLPTINPLVAVATPPIEESPSLFPYEVRLKLALAYIDMRDSEGACLLLEDVINDAPEDQKTYARNLLKSLQEKMAEH
jgi:FimV-like protein